MKGKCKQREALIAFTILYLKCCIFDLISDILHTIEKSTH
jgi:hypothetical protein